MQVRYTLLNLGFFLSSPIFICHLSFRLSVCLSDYLSACLSAVLTSSLAVCLYVCLSCLSTCLSVCPHLCTYTHVCMCLSACVIRIWSNVSVRRFYNEINTCKCMPIFHNLENRVAAIFACNLHHPFLCE